MNLYREFELSGINGQKAYCRVLKKLENYYTGEIVRYVRVDYSDGNIEFQLLSEEEFEDLMDFIVDEPSKPKNTQAEMEDFWNDI